MPRSYGGYVDPQEMWQMSGGNAWYDPLSPTPNVWGGIRATLNQMAAIKEKRRQEDEARRKEASAQAESQRRWEYEQKRADKESVARIQNWLETPIKSETEWEARKRVGDELFQQGKFPGGEKAYTEFGLTGQLPAPPKDKPAAKDTAGAELAKQVAADRKLLNTSIVSLGQAKTKVYSDKKMRPADKQAAMDGLNAALSRIGGYRELLSTNQPLPQGIRDTINAMAGDPTGLMTGDLTALGGASPAPQGPSQPTPDIQQIAREIINRAARKGRQLSQQEAEALANQYLQSKQNAIR